jgi:hypothetical protein
MSDPKHVSEVVRRALRGIPLDADLENVAEDECRGCGKLRGSRHSGAEDGYCAECATDRRRRGLWHTPQIPGAEPTPPEGDAPKGVGRND